MGEEYNDDLRKKKFHQVVRGRIEQLCKAQGLTYYALAYRGTIPLTTLKHIIDGASKNPGAYTIMKICDGLGITLKEFFDTKEFEDVINECD